MNPGATASMLSQPEAAAIPPEYHAGVATQLVALAAQARLVDELALPDDLEPAPIFTP